MLPIGIGIWLDKLSGGSFTPPPVLTSIQTEDELASIDTEADVPITVEG